MALGLNDWAARIHEVNVEHGFWPGPEGTERPFTEVIALVHSEVSEALEEDRSGKPNVYVPHHHDDCRFDRDPDGCYEEFCKPEGKAVELVDAMIRILDWCGQQGVDVDGLIEWKVAYNAGRPYKHGRAY